METQGVTLGSITDGNVEPKIKLRNVRVDVKRLPKRKLEQFYDSYEIDSEGSSTNVTDENKEELSSPQKIKRIQSTPKQTLEFQGNHLLHSTLHDISPIQEEEVQDNQNIQQSSSSSNSDFDSDKLMEQSTSEKNQQSSLNLYEFEPSKADTKESAIEKTPQFIKITSGQSNEGFVTITAQSKSVTGDDVKQETFKSKIKEENIIHVVLNDLDDSLNDLLASDDNLEDDYNQDYAATVNELLASGDEDSNDEHEITATEDKKENTATKDLEDLLADSNQIDDENELNNVVVEKKSYYTEEELVVFSQQCYKRDCCVMLPSLDLSKFEAL